VIFSEEIEPGIYQISFPGWGRDVEVILPLDEYEAYLNKYQPAEVLEFTIDFIKESNKNDIYESDHFDY